MAEPAGPVVLFDVMDTLVYDPFHREIPEFFGLSMKELLERKHPTAWLEFERSEIDEPEFARRFFLDGPPIDIDGLHAVLRQSYRWLDGVESVLADLGEGGCRLHALSNYPVWWKIIEEELGLSRYLSWDLVSATTGRRKPEPEAYLGAARDLGVDPADCLFVDDREVNCGAARAVGMRPLRFEGASTLRRALIDRGVLSR